jgi:hypothetical protein
LTSTNIRFDPIAFWLKTLHLLHWGGPGKCAEIVANTSDTLFSAFTRAYNIDGSAALDVASLSIATAGVTNAQNQL